MGKSLYIQRLAEDLKSHGLKQSGVHVTIPLHGPVVTPDTVLDLFEAHMKNPNPTCSIYHIDIAPNVSLQNSKCTQCHATLLSCIINTDLMGSGHHFV